MIDRNYPLVICTSEEESQDSKLTAVPNEFHLFLELTDEPYEFEKAGDYEELYLLITIAIEEDEEGCFNNIAAFEIQVDFNMPVETIRTLLVKNYGEDTLRWMKHIITKDLAKAITQPKSGDYNVFDFKNYKHKWSKQLHYSLRESFERLNLPFKDESDEGPEDNLSEIIDKLLQ